MHKNKVKILEKWFDGIHMDVVKYTPNAEEMGKIVTFTEIYLSVPLLLQKLGWECTMLALELLKMKMED